MGRSSVRGIPTLALLAATVLWGGSAVAAPQEGLPELDLEYLAPPECPSRGELLEELGRRLHPSWRSGADRRAFVVRISRKAGSFGGRLEVSRKGQETEAREFQADTCRAVSSALVVFIAIALDPASADVDPEAPRESRLEPSPSLEPPSSPKSVSPPPPKVRPAPPPPRAPPPSAWQFSSSVHARYLRAPQDAWGPRVDAQLARTLKNSRFAPALRLSYGYADFEVLPADGGTASFRLHGARASACAVVDLAPVPVRVSPCLGFEIGSLVASSRDIPQVGHASTSWSAMAGLIRASWSLLPWLAIEGEIGADVPFTRPSFALTEPVRIVYRPPSVLLAAGVGLAVNARFR